jgi:hypothetical protein
MFTALASELSLFSGPYHPASNSTYYILCEDVKSMAALAPAVFKVTSRKAFPGFIQDISSISNGSLRLSRR